MRRSLALTAAVAVLAATLPFAGAAGREEAPSGLFRVGDTGVRCLKQPCPWRGVVPVDDESVAAGTVPPAYAGDAPPVIAARPELLEQARNEIWRAWASGGCLLVHGRFERRGAAAVPMLSVDRIIGPCSR
ncbi:hypothetical protein [Inquilinus limosus]|uniref:hypothetical protein n=1 Tax=Inquilinus limosus TaxID=171674 RepID=UPI00126A6B03|nr:hypothetical protein [Inquilinus limosus]